MQKTSNKPIKKSDICLDNPYDSKIIFFLVDKLSEQNRAQSRLLCL